jgi:hypothetical protein
MGLLIQSAPSPPSTGTASPAVPVVFCGDGFIVWREPGWREFTRPS